MLNGPIDAKTAKVGVLMGSQSDWPIMQATAQTLTRLQVAYETRILSAHRTPDRAMTYGKTAASRGIEVVIAGAGGAAHLAGLLSAVSLVPVLSVPMPGQLLGIDSVFSSLQMPRGVPVGVLGVGESGAVNAALLAVAILSLSDHALAERWQQYRAELTATVCEQPHQEDDSGV